MMSKLCFRRFFDLLNLFLPRIIEHRDIQTFCWSPNRKTENTFVRARELQNCKTRFGPERKLKKTEKTRFRMIEKHVLETEKTEKQKKHVWFQNVFFLFPKK